MEVEFTARQVKISKALRTQAEEGMERIARILGKTARASVTFGAQRHVQIVELTVQARLQTIVATGKADTPDAALRQAMEHAENQARRYPGPAYGWQAVTQRREGARRTSSCPAQGSRRTRGFRSG